VAYTLAMFFLWGIAMAVVGAMIGWMLRSLGRRREVAELRAQVEELEAAARKRGPTPGPPL
jgi:cell division protein FtsX